MECSKQIRRAEGMGHISKSLAYCRHTSNRADDCFGLNQ